MKVIMQSRENLFSCPGGDTIQLLKTKEYLEKIGIQVDINLELEPDLSKYDIVHLFNLTRVQETYIQMLNAKSQKKPIILSTIYWPSFELEKNGQFGMRGMISKVLSINNIESLKAIYKYFIRKEKNKGTKYLMTHSFASMQIEILKNCEWFLPNSVSEIDMISKYIKFDTSSYNVVPNAVDIENVNDRKYTNEFEKYRGYILSVGRIETRKNQLNLLKAIEGTDYKLLLVGKVAPGHKKYAKKVLDIVKKNNNIEYIESVDNDKLYSLYKVCKVHVLPSWFETPGLVSLEAGAMGASIVVSDRGTTRDYFKEYAYYCQPNDISSIKEAIDSAYSYPKNTEKLHDMIVNDYTWNKAAQATLEGYKSAIKIYNK